MTSERWAQVDSVLQAVLGQSPGERDAFLRHACAGDPALEAEVRSLVASQQEAGSFLESPAMEVAARALAAVHNGDAPAGGDSIAGQTVSHYRIVERLGHGGMGVVWKALDMRLDRFVALKFLPAANVSDPERKRRFIQEARAASALNHPNIITIYEFGQAGPVGHASDFIAMEFVPGKTLDQLISRKGLPLSEALPYAIQVAGALAAAHAAGIVHRDLKPGNVMVNENGCVKVLDFGLAKLIEEGGESGEGTIAGTVSYMSPEQAEGRKVDPRTDIFSFGSVLYEVVTGRRAFAGDSQTSTLAAILRDQPKPAAEVVPDLPRELERIIARCLRKDPARRFQTMADLKVALEDLKEDSDSGALAPVAAPRRRRLAPYLWAAGAAVLATGVLAGWLLHSPVKVSEDPLAAIPLTAFAGNERYPTFSPEGNQVAFSWNGDKQDNFDIYVKLIGAGPPLRLTTDPAEDLSPAWSPDGRSIAFLRRLPGGKAAVMLISPLGGAERMVAEVRDVAPTMWDYSGLLSWCPDNKCLAVADQPFTGEPVGLFLLSVDTGEKRRLTRPPSKIIGDIGPAISPDGRMLAFTRATGNVVNDLYVVRLSSAFAPEGDPKRLTFDNRRTYSPAWMPGSHEIVFASNRVGVYCLWRIPVSGGKPPRRLESFGEDAFSLSIAHQAHRLAYMRRWANINIWRIDLAGAQSERAPAGLKPSVLINSSRQNMSAAISPDGNKIAFSSNRSGFPEIWVSDSNGLNQVQLTSFAAHSGSPAWSPDGALIAFDCNVSGHFDLYVVKAGGGRPVRLTSGESDNAVPRWSRDGKWIYFHSLRSGEYQIWKTPSAGGAPVQVTQRGGYVAAESADGAYLYYTKTDLLSGLWRMPVAGGEEMKVLEAVMARSFAVVRDGIYFFAPGPRSALLQFYRFATGRKITLGAIEKTPYLYMDVSADGRWLSYSQYDQRLENLMLVENFR